MRGADEFRTAVEAGDVRQVQRISEIAEPHLPRLTYAEAERIMHDARTRSKTVPFAKRAYSHRWLVERGLDSGLPDRLRPKAEQVAPVIAFAVGVAVGTGNPFLKPALRIVSDRMQLSILEAEADGKLLDADYVRARLLDTKHRTMKELFGTLAIGGGNHA